MTAAGPPSVAPAGDPVEATAQPPSAQPPSAAEPPSAEPPSVARPGSVTPAELRTLFLFEGLPGEDLAWLSARGERAAFEAGAVVHVEGDDAQWFYVLLEGRLRLVRTAAGEDVVVNETSHRGSYAGALRAFLSAGDTRYTTSLHAVAPSSLYRLPARDFARFMTERFPIAVHLLDGLSVGIRETEATLRERERLAGIGSLSANLAHELNNPASAGVRATAQLRSATAELRAGLGGLASGELAPAVLRELVALQERAVATGGRVAGPGDPAPLGPVARADAEDALADLLDDHGVGDGHEVAPVLVAAGLAPEDVAPLLAAVPAPSRPAAVRWLSGALEVEQLLDELAHATRQISSLVAAVKEYSQRDAAGVQDVDVRAGLAATVVMLGHQLQGVAVVRDDDPDLPVVRADGAELNQVWTNLVVNAAEALGGRGTLRITTRRDGDGVRVVVADDGPGMTPAVAARALDRFFTTKGATGGTGLGLDRARRIVEVRHGGRLAFTTGPSGTAFTVVLPAAPAPASERPVAAEPAPTEPVPMEPAPTEPVPDRSAATGHAPAHPTPEDLP